MCITILQYLAPLHIIAGFTCSESKVLSRFWCDFPKPTSSGMQLFRYIYVFEPEIIRKYSVVVREHYLQSGTNNSVVAWCVMVYDGTYGVWDEDTVETRE